VPRENLVKNATRKKCAEMVIVADRHVDGKVIAVYVIKNTFGSARMLSYRSIWYRLCDIDV